MPTAPFELQCKIQEGRVKEQLTVTQHFFECYEQFNWSERRDLNSKSPLAVVYAGRWRHTANLPELPAPAQQKAKYNALLKDRDSRAYHVIAKRFAGPPHARAPQK